MMHTHLRDELELLERIGALTREELASREPREVTRRASSPASESPPSERRALRVREMAAPLETPDRALDGLPRLGLDVCRDQDLRADAAGVPLRGLALPARRAAAGADPRVCAAAASGSRAGSSRRSAGARDRAARARRRRRDARRDADRLEHRRDDRRLGAAAGDPAAHACARAGRDWRRSSASSSGSPGWR